MVLLHCIKVSPWCHLLYFQMSSIPESLGPLFATVGAVSTLAGVAAIYYISKMPEPGIIPPVDLNDQSLLMEVY